MKFSHLADCHLGGWRQPELNNLNFKSFQKAISLSINERVDFMLIAGDLFDSAYPPIDTLREAFGEFRKLREAKIPVFLIAGSHDYSVSGKTFLDVLEEAGLCINVTNFEEKNEKLTLLPTIYKNIAIYGYPGKKSGLEVDEIEKINLQDSPGLFRILMLHTTINDAVSNPQIKSVEREKLPKVDYLALGHLHIRYNKKGLVYPGPTFPNSISEIEDLNHGSFCIFENNTPRHIEINLANVFSLKKEITNALSATEELTTILSKQNIKGKIVVLRIYGILQNGRSSDIEFSKIESFVKSKGAITLLKSTSQLHSIDSEIKINYTDTENLEAEVISQFKSANPNPLNELIPGLIKSLQTEKIEGETSSVFESRVLSEAKKVIGYETQEINA